MKKLFINSVAVILISSLFATYAFTEAADKNVRFLLEVKIKERWELEDLLNIFMFFRILERDLIAKRQFSVLEDIPVIVSISECVYSADYFKNYLYKNGYISEEDMNILEMETQLAVFPQWMGKAFKLRVIPQINYITDKRMKVISLDELSVEVFVRDGQGTIIGGIVDDPYFGRKFFQLDNGRNIEIVLIPRLEGAEEIPGRRHAEIDFDMRDNYLASLQNSR